MRLLARLFGESPDDRSMRGDLRRLHDVLASTSFSNHYRACGGVLLGWAREGRLIPNDPDADFFYAAGDADLFESATPRLADAGFEPAYRFVNNDNIPTEYSFLRNGRKFEFFRLFPARDGRARYFTYSPAPVPLQMTAEIPDQAAVPFRFLGRTWLKPTDHELELHAMYGEWWRPDPTWSYLDERCIIDRQTWLHTEFAWGWP